MNEATTFRNEIRDTYAFTALETAKLEGALISFQDRSLNSPVIVWSIPGNETREEVVENSTIEDVTKRTFAVPRQYGCSCHSPECYLVGIYPDHKKILLFPTPMMKPPGTDKPSIHAQILFEDFEWSVKTWDADSVSAVFKLHAERHHPRGTARV